MLDLNATLTLIGETAMAKPKITNEQEALAAVKRNGKVLKNAE